MDYRQQQAPTQFPWPPGQQNQNVNRRWIILKGDSIVWTAGLTV